MNARQRFLKACKYEPVDRPPVWLMRQAGRSLSEYRSMRKKHSFWELCRTPELAAEVTLQPLRRFAIDAAIIFSDILVLPNALGMKVTYSPRLIVSPPIKDSSDVKNLELSRLEQKLDYVVRAIKLVSRELESKKAVLGFSGAPYTLSCYMIEGRGSSHFLKVREMMYNQPKLFRKLQEKLVTAVTDYLLLQINASATAVQIFDTWAGELNPDDYKSFVLPYVSRIIESIKSKKGVPIIYYINGIGNLLKPAAASGADVIGVDWRLKLKSVRNILGNKTIVQGNLEPALLFAAKEKIQDRVHSMLDETMGIGHIANLGHGLLPQTPIAGIEAFVQAVIDWKPASKN